MKRRYYLEDLALADALARFDAALEQAGGLTLPPTEDVPLSAALGRVTATPVWARMSSPHYHAAAMDGIAVRALDTFGATDVSPRDLAVGSSALWINTGNPMPAGRDAVIMAEHVQQQGEDVVQIRAAAAPWQHVRQIGEDIVATELVLAEQHTIRPVDLGVLAASGHANVTVRGKPQVTIIPTGSELIDVDAVDAAKPGDIIEFNSLMLAGQVQEWGGNATRHPPLPDRRDTLRNAISAALDTCDILVVNAGSSAGSEDYTADVLAELGQVLVHGVAIRPGHPAILALVRGKPVLGLPGYPVSTMLTAELFLRPLVYRLQGSTPPPHPTMTAIFSRKLLSPMGEDEFVRVTLGTVGERTVATPLTRGAGVVTSLMRADGLVRIPRFSEGLHAGAEVEVELLREPSAISGTVVVTGSHDLALDLLGSHIRRANPRARLVSANVGSLGGLLALKRGDAHIAGTHLLDEAAGVYNRPFLDRLLPGEDVLLVHLAMREQGLIVPQGNPQNLRGIEDLLRDGVRFVNRQKGSGTRVLLDYQLGKLGLTAGGISGYEHEEFTHMAVAAAVAGGTATAGLGILAAARALGLAFIPLFSEQYDLAVPVRHWESPVLLPVRRALASPAYRAAVTALGGYNTDHMGEVA